MKVRFYLRKLQRVHKKLKKFEVFLESKLLDFNGFVSEADEDLKSGARSMYLWLEERLFSICNSICFLEDALEQLKIFDY